MPQWTVDDNRLAPSRVFGWIMAGSEITILLIMGGVRLYHIVSNWANNAAIIAAQVTPMPTAIPAATSGSSSIYDAALNMITGVAGNLMAVTLAIGFGIHITRIVLKAMSRDL